MTGQTGRIQGKDVVMLKFYFVNMISRLRGFADEEDGFGTIEAVLLLIVAIAVVVLFKGQIMNIVGTLLEKVASQSSAV